MRDPSRPGRDLWAELTESLVQGYVLYANAHLDERGGAPRLYGLRTQTRAAMNEPPVT